MAPECPQCDHPELDTEEDNDALADDDQFDYFCVTCGGLFTEEDLE